jgi:hypothetical protein
MIRASHVVWIAPLGIALAAAFGCSDLSRSDEGAQRSSGGISITSSGTCACLVQQGETLVTDNCLGMTALMCGAGTCKVSGGRQTSCGFMQALDAGTDTGAAAAMNAEAAAPPAMPVGTTPDCAAPQVCCVESSAISSGGGTTTITSYYKCFPAGTDCLQEFMSSAENICCANPNAPGC